MTFSPNYQATRSVEERRNIALVEWLCCAARDANPDFGRRWRRELDSLAASLFVSPRRAVPQHASLHGGSSWQEPWRGHEYGRAHPRFVQLFWARHPYFAHVSVCDPIPCSPPSLPILALPSASRSASIADQQFESPEPVSSIGARVMVAGCQEIVDPKCLGKPQAEVRSRLAESLLERAIPIIGDGHKKSLGITPSEADGARNPQPLDRQSSALNQLSYGPNDRVIAIPLEGSKTGGIPPFQL